MNASAREWRCRRCKTVFVANTDAELHYLATDHSYFLLTIDGDTSPAYRDRPRLIHWPTQMYCPRWRPPAERHADAEHHHRIEVIITTDPKENR